MASSVINKIEKILKLAESDNIHEASNALSKAQSLAEKYNIQIELLQGSKFKPTEKIVIYSQEYSEPFKSNLEDWELILIKIISDINNCKVWSYGGQHLDIIGFSVDIEIVDRMFLWLRSQVLSLMLLKPQGDKEAFLLGVMFRIKQKLEESKIQARNELNHFKNLSYAIQRVDDKKYKVLSEFRKIKIENSETREPKDQSSWISGFNKAETIQVQKGMIK